MCTACVAVCLDCAKNITFYCLIHGSAKFYFFDSSYGISHGFDITLDLLLMAWNFNDILIFFSSELYR